MAVHPQAAGRCTMHALAAPCFCLLTGVGRDARWGYSRCVSPMTEQISGRFQTCLLLTSRGCDSVMVPGNQSRHHAAEELHARSVDSLLSQERRHSQTASELVPDAVQSQSILTLACRVEKKCGRRRTLKRRRGWVCLWQLTIVVRIVPSTFWYQRCCRLYLRVH